MKKLLSLVIIFSICGCDKPLTADEIETGVMSCKKNDLRPTVEYWSFTHPQAITKINCDIDWKKI